MKKVVLLSCTSVILFLAYAPNAHSMAALEIRMTAYISDEPIDFGSLSSTEQDLMYLESRNDYSWSEYRYLTNPIARPGDSITYFITAGNTGRFHGCPPYCSPTRPANDVKVFFENEAGLTLNDWWYWIVGSYTWPPPINVVFGPDHALWFDDRLSEYIEMWFVVSSSIDPDYDQDAIMSSARVLSSDPEEYFLDNETVCEISIVASVPEPATILLMSSGLVGLVGLLKRFGKE